MSFWTLNIFYNNMSREAATYAYLSAVIGNSLSLG